MLCPSPFMGWGSFARLRRSVDCNITHMSTTDAPTPKCWLSRVSHGVGAAARDVAHAHAPRHRHGLGVQRTVLQQTCHHILQSGYIQGLRFTTEQRTVLQKTCHHLLQSGYRA